MLTQSRSHCQRDYRTGLQNVMATAGLLALDVRRLDDRPPLLNFRFLKSAKDVWCLLVAWKYLLTEVCEPRAHSGVSQSVRGGGIEPFDNFSRCTCRRPQRQPRREIELGQPRFINRRHIRH